MRVCREVTAAGTIGDCGCRNMMPSQNNVLCVISSVCSNVRPSTDRVDTRSLNQDEDRDTIGRVARIVKIGWA